MLGRDYTGQWLVGGGVPVVMVYRGVVRMLVPHRGTGPGASVTGPKHRIWEKTRETSKKS